MLLESIKMSWENIIHNKLRSFLTMLGIVIGVASVIALITIVQGATSSIGNEVAALGANKVTINAYGTPLKRGISDEDMENIAAIDNISGISPTISGKTSIVHNGNVMDGITVQGKNEVYFKTASGLLKSGRAINVLDVRGKNRVALIGDYIAKQLYFGVDPVGKQLQINGMTFTIIGTLSVSGEFSITSNNEAVIIPYTTALRCLGVKNISGLDVYLENTELADDTIIAIKGVLNAAFNYKEDAYFVFNMGDLLETFQTMMSMLSMLLAGIAAISLVVGGIGIMNMMLVSITERTTEIGLRKALGATPKKIRLQFIIESIFLSVVGGFFGLILGSIVAYVATDLIGINFAITISTISIAVGFSAAVGIAFGYMPARKASKLNPIDALRSL